jgi:hypothetical protein
MKLSKTVLSAGLGLGAVAVAALSSGAEAAKFQQYKNGVCGPVAVCTIDFGVVPAGKTLEISDASCYLRTTEDANFFAMQLLVMNGATTTSALTLGPFTRLFGQLAAPGDSVNVYQVNSPVYAFATAGQRFRGYAEIRGGQYRQFACHVSGQLTP